MRFASDPVVRYDQRRGCIAVATAASELLSTVLYTTRIAYSVGINVVYA